MKKMIKPILWWIRYWKQSRKSAGNKFDRRAKYMKFARKAKKNGVVDFRVDRIATEFTNAWYAINTMPAIEKKWYMDHGFNPSAKCYCGVSKDNYKQYISYFEFYNSQNYVNHTGAQWFDDKLNTYYLLAPFADNLPKHYFYAVNGVMYPLEVRVKRICQTEDIVSLIKEKAIAAKKCLGGHGEGFYKLEYTNGTFLANDKEISERDIKQIIKKLDGYIITEFVKPAKYLREIAGEDAFAVMRAMVIFDDVDGPQFERLMLRLGTTKSGHTQALHDYLYIGIDENGLFYNPLIELSDYDFEKIEVHPDTGKKLLGNSLRNLDKLKGIVKEISSYLPMTPYLILDIIPTDDSFLILEINSHGQPFNFEPFEPVKESKYFKKIFRVKSV